MTMPELLAAICAAQDEARKAGATDYEVQELRRTMIDEHRTEATGQEYASQWSGAVPQVQQRRPPVNPGRTTDRKGDLF